MYTPRPDPPPETPARFIMRPIKPAAARRPNFEMSPCPHHAPMPPLLPDVPEPTPGPPFVLPAAQPQQAPGSVAYVHGLTSWTRHHRGIHPAPQRCPTKTNARPAHRHVAHGVCRSRSEGQAQKPQKGVSKCGMKASRPQRRAFAQPKSAPFVEGVAVWQGPRT